MSQTIMTPKRPKITLVNFVIKYLFPFYITLPFSFTKKRLPIIRPKDYTATRILRRYDVLGEGKHSLYSAKFLQTDDKLSYNANIRNMLLYTPDHFPTANRKFILSNNSTVPNKFFTPLSKFV